MDEQAQNQPPMTPPQQEMPKEEKGVGGVIGIIIIVIILIVAGAYLFANRPVSQAPAPTVEMTDETSPATSEELRTQGTSDTVGAIESDLNNTDLDNLDAELDGIQNEVNQAQ